MGNQDVGGVGRFLGIHPALNKGILGDEYDSAGEPEANGRPYEQPEAGDKYSTFAKAKARTTDLPILAPILNDPDDLLAGAPKRGDMDDPTGGEPDEVR